MRRNILLIALAFYTLIYIVLSFVFHLKSMIHVGHFTPKEILWLSIKVPVMAFCVITLVRSGKEERRT